MAKPRGIGEKYIKKIEATICVDTFASF